ncbi:MAG: ADP-heptose--LPS heptosyltransferase [Chlorobi bacterium]|nr:ADP-heptose--LPS heptosyltransferase [Chlorobiota bacterium]
MSKRPNHADPSIPREGFLHRRGREVLNRLAHNEHFLNLFAVLVGVLRSHPPVGEVRRVLIYKPDHMGDMLMATSALRAIRRRYPDAEIRIAAGEWCDAILAGNPNVDQVVRYNSTLFLRPPYRPDSFRDLRARLGSWRPDLVIGLRDDWKTLLGALFSSVPHIQRGSVHLREYLHRRRTGEPRQHEIKRLAELLAPLGIDLDPEAHLDYFVTPEEEEEAGRFLADNGIDVPFATIHTGASQKLREWSLERFAEMARHIVATHGLRIVLIGSGGEVERSAGLAALIGDLNPIDLTGRLDLRSMAAVLKRASLYLGSDGGLMHMAAVVGTRTLGLFGPGLHHMFRPIGRQVATVYHQFPCSPCDQVHCVRPDDTCMQAVTIAEVIEETEKLMERGGRSDPTALQP